MISERIHDVLASLGIREQHSIWARRAIEKRLCEDLLQRALSTALLEELIHILRGQNIREYGMWKNDMKSPTLYKELKEARLLTDGSWKSLRAFPIIELTAKGIIIGKEVGLSLFKSIEYQQIPHLPLLSVWFQYRENAALLPALPTRFPDSGYTDPLGREIDILPELPYHSKIVHSELEKSWQWLTDNNLASKVHYYVSTRGGETRQEEYITSRNLGREIIHLVPQSRKQQITDSFLKVWNKYERKFGALNYLRNTTWGANKARDELLEHVLDLYKDFSCAHHIKIANFDEVLQGKEIPILEDISILEEWIESKRSEYEQDIESDLRELLKREIFKTAHKLTIQSNDLPSRGPIPSQELDRSRSTVAAILKTSPRASIEAIANISRISIDKARDIVFELVDEGTVSGLYDFEEDEFRSREAIEMARVMQPKDRTISKCVYCGKDFGKDLVPGDKITCPNCKKTNIGR